MNQKLARYPNLTKITINPGSVNPSNNPKTQKKIAPNERSMNFIFSTPVD